MYVNNNLYFVVGNLVTEIYISRSYHLSVYDWKECFPHEFALFPYFECYTFLFGSHFNLAVQGLFKS